MSATNYALKKTTPDPEPIKSEKLSEVALHDANVEDIRYLQDLSLEIRYAEYAPRGIKYQNFKDIRELAFQDIFEDLEQDPSKNSLRETPLYAELSSRFVSLAEQFAQPESDRAWLLRVASRNRRNMERFARTNDVNLLRDAGRAAAEILEREMPKQSRAQLNIGPQIHINEAGAALLAKAFAEAKLPMPQLPAVIDAEVIEDEKK